MEDQAIPVLKSTEEVIYLKTGSVRQPIEYFKDREGLWVGSQFQAEVSGKAEATLEGAEFKIDSWDLVRYANDETIEGSLHKKHLFSESAVCAIIAELIEKQPKGEEGHLLNNGYANLFYTKSFVVYVGWGRGAGKWIVGAWSRDDDVWDAGGRVFSPAI